MTTTISVTNSLDEFPLALTSTVLPALSSEYWTPIGNSATPNGQPVNAVWFNRNEGIKKNKTWIFTTSFVLDGITVLLQEKVTGTTAGSDMWQSMSAGGSATGWVDTNNTASIQFTGASGAIYRVVWTLSGSGSGYKNINYRITLLQPGLKPITPVMTQVKTVVMLMLENRSLDHLLGWLYRDGAPAIVFPAGSSPKFDGIPPGASNSANGTSYSPPYGTSGYPEYYRVPAFDPYEAMDQVKFQLYGNASGQMPGGYFWDQTPPMTGFVENYSASYIQRPGEVMGGYNNVQLPVLYGLAENFAVSDRWFSSAPTQTDPNRAFSVCGTSLGAESNADIDASTYVNANTLFNLLGDGGKTWGMYWQSKNPLGTGEPITSWNPYTSYFFPRMLSAKNGGVYPYETFLSALTAGTLPNFCYLEPFWGGGKGDEADSNNSDWVGIQGNDYHPPACVGPAEASLNTLYEALVKSPQWKDMLFIITFDEHGGTWDHVPPPAAVPPDIRVGNSGFKFDRMGVRVPTILVSPYIQKGTVFRAPDGSTYDYDHTSFIATLLKWAGIDPTSSSLGARVSVAPTFEDVLSTTRRTDTPRFTVPQGYADQGGGLGNVSLDQLGPYPLNVHEFREAADDSKTLEEFEARLRALTYKPPKLA